MSSFIQDSNYNSRGPAYVPSQKTTWSFPLLKTDEIVKCLNELGIPVRQDELLDPENHKEACRRMLESLAEICTGISKEEMAQPTFAGLQAVTHPELHEESIPKFNQFRACCKMMEICEIPDFSLKDIMTPTAPRLRRHLSGIINFAKFREERLLLLSELSTKREGLVERLSHLRDGNETLNNRLSLLREQTAEESSIITALEQECHLIESNISALNMQQNRLKDETATLQEASAELKETLAVRYRQQEELSTQRKALSMQIVSSPEKFRKQIVEVGEHLQTEQKETKVAEKKVRELTAWLTNVDESTQEVGSAIEAITELRAEVDRQKTVMAELEAQKQSIVTERVALSELAQNAQQVQRSAARAEEKLAQLRKQVQVRGRDSQQATEDLHKQLIDAEAFRLQVSARVERQAGEVARLESEMQEDSRTQEEEVADITANYQRLEKVVVAHLQGLQRALEGSEQAAVAGPFTAPTPAPHNKSVDESSVLSASYNNGAYNGYTNTYNDENAAYNSPYSVNESNVV